MPDKQPEEANPDNVEESGELPEESPISAETTEKASDQNDPPKEMEISSEAMLTEVRKEKEELYDQLLRSTAEFENYRKRIERERRERSALAATDIMLELLAVIDDLERAIHAPAENNAETYRQGVELILRQMLELLRKRDVKPIEALGVDFDPNYHEAVVHEPSTDHKDGEVIEELRRGYTIGGRLLRPSMVKVAKSS
tara:strand:+ start:4669 stop:5265 length:597 start_codon:yes stop_codon:yes gene_type:complete